MQAFALDHVGIAVRDLDACYEEYTRLGFTLTQRSGHLGRATGNHCAMLRDGYLELLGIVNRGIPSRFGALIERYQGAHIVAFGCADANETYRALRDKEPSLAPPQLLERETLFGLETQIRRQVAFKNIHLPESRFPEARFLFIEHLNRAVLWQRHLTEHANGAVGLAEVVVCSDDVADTANRLAHVLGRSANIPNSQSAIVEMANGRLLILAPAALAQWAPEVDSPAVPAVVGIGLKVKDLDATKHYFRQAALPYQDHSHQAIWLNPEHASGVVISFIQS